MKDARAVAPEKPPPGPKEASAGEAIESVAAAVEKELGGTRGAPAAAFARLLYARATTAYFARVPPSEAAADAVSLHELLEKPFDGFRVRLRDAGAVKEGSRTGRKRLVLETAGPDQPFILDSLLELLRVRGHSPREVLHPIAAVDRGPDGSVTSVGPPRKGAELVSVIHIELPPDLAGEERKDLLTEADEVLREARVVVQDFEPMLQRLQALEEELASRSRELAPGPGREEMREAAAFLSWLRKANFVFLGYRTYDVRGAGAEAVAEVRHGSGLGILRDERRSTFADPKLLSSLPHEVTDKILNPMLVLVHKANSDSRVLRRARMDYVGVKMLDEKGRVVGEHRFLGLFTSRAYNDLPSDVPILRRKLEEILERANVVPGSHDHKEIFSIFTSFPKYELFMTDTARLADMIFSIMSSANRRTVRVSYRPDYLERGVSVMVLIPKEKFNADVRAAIQQLLAREFHGAPVDYRLALSEAPMARLHFYFATRTGDVPSPGIVELEAKVSQLMRAWEDRLLEALAREHGPEEAEALAGRYARAFPAAYVASKSPEIAVADIRNVDRALREGKLQVSVSLGKVPAGGKASILKLYRPREAYALSTLMPILTHLGLHVIDEQTFRILPAAPDDSGEAQAKGKRAARREAEVFLHSFRVLGPGGTPLPAGKVTRNIEETIPSVLAGDVDDDPLNALIVRAALDRRQTAVLRAYVAYLLQLGGPWTQRTTYSALCENPGPAALLVKLFEVRFDPRLAPKKRSAEEERVRSELRAALERVQAIIDDQALRSLENLMTSTVRTSYFLRDAAGTPPPAFAIKIQCASVYRMPEPRPLYEVFVHNARIEGVHLRSGKVARGGIRWSSRPDDFRMEILSLMKAQRTKNAVIVPVGAKGGYILRRAPPSPPPEDIRAGYEVFIGSLLDVTDNVVKGKVVHPEGVVVHDEEDPYLVVAADRGTASFSDLANAIATSRSFWLGDAFASGGSKGYNHKQLGITARGAWECVRRHFREMGIDPDRSAFTVAGIGDMSGDVFGNGMLYSNRIRLLAAFNHAHVFIDPDPDPVASFEERKRLFELPGSAWTDYDPKRIGEGGGVYSRDAKSIALSPRARQVLGLTAETPNGEDLVRAILKMSVDLLFNGGIGTYVKASSESHLDVSDPSNNAVRIDGAEVRARVVAEGGNLGFTQLGRIEYARAGGRLNTDFIDNSAGVDLSDHEVNLKILLARSIERGAISEDERDEVLQGAAAQVGEAVLRDNYLQSCVLSVEERRSAAALDEHLLLIDDLTVTGVLNRSLERIPSDQELLRLREFRMGLTRPHLAVLLAYAKIDAYLQALATVPLSRPEEDPDLREMLVGYFPAGIATRFAEDVSAHPLWREIAVTSVVNAAINRMGVAFFHRTARRSGARFDAVLRAFVAAWQLCGGDAFHAAMDELYAGGFADMGVFFAALARFQKAAADVVHGVLRRGLKLRSGRAVAVEYAPRIHSRLERLSIEHDLERPEALAILPAAIQRRVLVAERIAGEMDLADVVRQEAASAEPAAAAWSEAASALLLERVEAEAFRITLATEEDHQARASLRERAHECRRRLTRAMLRKPGALLAVKSHRERARAAKLLEMARTREPLTLSGLYVVVEALERAVAEASEVAS